MEIQVQSKKKPELAVILAAGLGSRMGGHTATRPKGFIEIGNEPIIMRSIRILSESGIGKIIIGTGHLCGFYENLARKTPCVQTVMNPDYADSGSFYTLYNMADAIDGDFLLLESDLIYEKRAVSHLSSLPEPDVILASGTTGSKDEVFIETDGRGNLVNMSKDPAELSRIDGELVGISKISVDSFSKMIGLFNENKSLVKKIEYETALIMLARTLPIAVSKIDDLAWTEIDTIEHLKRAKEIIFPRITARDGRV